MLHYQSSFENYVFNDSQRLNYLSSNKWYVYMTYYKSLSFFYPSISKPPHFYKAISHW